jgi:hypothetical protein
MAKNPFNQRNPRLMNYLCAYKAPDKTLFWSFYVSFCTFCASLRLKITAFNRPIQSLPTYQVSLRNPLLINYLRAFDIFTLVESALQISPFCSNKPNFRKSQMNVSSFITGDYDKMDTWSPRKNKPNSNPKQSQFKPNQSQNKPNTNPKQTQFQRQKNEKKVSKWVISCNIFTGQNVLSEEYVIGSSADTVRSKDMKKIILYGLLIVITCYCSSCATMWGGIIGHQSGELAAGMAIGAAIDFGDDLVRGICYMTADVPKEFKNNSQINADEGTIQLPGIAFNIDRMRPVKEKLKDKMSENGWEYKVAKKTADTSLFNKDRYSENWNCVTQGGKAFELKICYKQDEDAHLRVTVGPDSTGGKGTITSKIYDWLEEISNSLA